MALLALREGVDLEDGASLAGISGRVSLDAEGARIDGKSVSEDELRTPEVSAAASTVSARPEVRAVLLVVRLAGPASRGERWSKAGTSAPSSCPTRS